MPGMTFETAVPNGVAARAAAAPGSPAAVQAAVGPDLGFVVWLVVFGVVLPAVVFGGLRAGGFRFVFVGR